MSRLTHFLNSRLTDGSEVVSFTYWLAFIPRKIPGTHFYFRPNQAQAHNVWLEGLGQLKTQ
jgi:hypothetical protein